jgi:septum formation topological specificity factor MinE
VQSVNPTERAIEIDPLIHPDLKADLIRIYRSYVETSRKMLENEGRS